MTVPRESQPDRTRLAWGRTALALTATVLLAVALAVRREPTIAAAMTLLPAIAMAAAGLGLARQRMQALRRSHGRRLGPTAAALALLVTGTAIAAVVLVLLG